jgi:N-acetylglucosamine-6-phosphate deacetylase
VSTLPERFTIRNVRIVRPGRETLVGDVRVAAGRIEAVGPGLAGPAGAIIEGNGRLLTPGFVDVHTHGIHRFRYEAGAAEFLEALTRRGRYGCTCVLPTLIGRTEPAFLDTLVEVANAISDARGAAVAGLHLEGPFLAYTGAGCTVTPGDTVRLRELLVAAGGHVRAMSVSPEVENILPVIECLREEGVVPFITHTGATLEQTRQAIDAGARHATHFYDVFYPQPETDLGVRPVACVEAILADRRVSADFICDGVHVEPTAIRMTLYAKGWENVMLITDSNVGAGLPPGEYDTPWGFRIYAHPDKAARIIGEHRYAGALAGSALTMNRGMANLLRWFGDEWSEEQLWALGTANPARLIGLDAKGRLDPGADADMVLWDDDFQPRTTWVAGRVVYQAGPDSRRHSGEKHE